MECYDEMVKKSFMTKEEQKITENYINSLFNMRNNDY